jgi:hypothetical protein
MSGHALSFPQKSTTAAGYFGYCVIRAASPFASFVFTRSLISTQNEPSGLFSRKVDFHETQL